jgi:hypothetical protein
MNAVSTSMQIDTKLQDPPDPLWNSVNNFLHWLDIQGYESYDPYDVWGTRYGCFSRRVYYKSSVRGLPLIAPMLLLEILFPRWRSLVVRKDRYATGDSQLILAFLNLYELTGDMTYIEKARELARSLLETSIPGHSGHCWGYPFAWENNCGLWQRDTPVITATPYCFEAFVGLFDETGEQSFLDTAASIARFVHKDLVDSPTSADAAAASYSPIDRSHVVNASAYRAMVMFEAAHRFGVSEYHETGQRNLNFILQTQREDGAWVYATDEPSQRFIDHFHTVFVIKNLIKLNRRLNSPAVAESVRKGYDYYRRELFSADGLPKSFSVKPRTQIVQLEMYNFAEAITLGALLANDIPEAFAHSQQLATVLARQHQLPDGHFVTRVYIGGFKHTLPFLRWPQAQLFYSLTNLLLAKNHVGSAPSPSNTDFQKERYHATGPSK